MKSRFRRLALEALEDRTLMSTCHVTRLSDAGNGKGFRGDLRYCINKVNAEPGPDVIDFKIAGNNIDLNSSLPELTSDIDIQGPGVDAMWVVGHGKRIFQVSSQATVEISGLSLVEGGTSGLTQSGGAINNNGTLTVHDTRFFQNYSTHFGGAVHNSGNLTILASKFTGNESSAGGAIYNAGTLTIEDTVFEGNFILGNYFGNLGGGAIYNSGTISITSTTFSGNTSKTPLNDTHPFGGAILNNGMMWMDSSTVSNNLVEHSDEASRGYGGGICNFTNGTMVIRNSTVANNIAGWGGGGIMSFGPFAKIEHSTVAGNDARVGGGLWSYDDFTVILRNNIVATNTADGSELGPDVIGQFTSAGHNLIGNSNQGGGFASTDLLNVDPLLGPLADNGGPTLTHALLPGSPAIDAGDNTDAPEWDQRGPGFPRIVNGTIDIGAFEVQSTNAPKPPSGGDPLFLVTVVHPTTLEHAADVPRSGSITQPRVAERTLGERADDETTLKGLDRTSSMQPLRGSSLIRGDDPGCAARPWAVEYNPFGVLDGDSE